MTAAEHLTTAVAAPVPGRYQVAGLVYEVTARPEGGVRILRVGSRSRWVVAAVRADGSVWLRSLQPQVREQVRVLLADPDGARRAYTQLTGRCCMCGQPLTNPGSAAAGLGPQCAETTAATTTQESLR